MSFELYVPLAGEEIPETVSVNVEGQIIKGNDGFSPIIYTQSIANGVKVTITDAIGDHVFYLFNGRDGEVHPEEILEAIQEYFLEHPLANVASTGRYEDLINKPEIPNVPEWALNQNKPEYTAEEVGALSAEMKDPIESAFDDISGIKELIPNQATETNKLADKDFVNSSIATNTAYYISKDGEPFSSVEELEAFSGTLTNNDYAFVVGTDAAGNVTYTRYKYNADTAEWAEEFVLNNSSFTAEQWNAITSGITASIVLSTQQHITNKSNPHEVTYQQLGGTKPSYTADEVGAYSASDGEALEEVVAGKQPIGDYVTKSYVGGVIELSEDKPTTEANEMWVEPEPEEVFVLDSTDIDATLTESGKVAEAKAVGEKIAEIAVNLGGCKFAVVDGILTVTYDGGTN